MGSEVKMGQLQKPSNPTLKSMLRGILYSSKTQANGGYGRVGSEEKDTAVQGISRGHLLLEKGLSDFSLLSSVTSEDPDDDGISLISAESYLKFRLLPAINRLNTEIPVHERWHVVGQFLILFATMMASVCGVIGLHVWIPSVAALVAGVESVLNFDQTSARLTGANAALTQLKNLKLWWHSLSRTQQSLPLNKEQLVLSAEDAIESDVSAWTQGMLRKKRKVDAADEDDETNESN